MKKEVYTTKDNLPEMRQSFSVSLTMTERQQLVKKYGSLTDGIKTLLEAKQK